MIVFGLDIEDFEYAYQIDGPYEPENGLLLNPHSVLSPQSKPSLMTRAW